MFDRAAEVFFSTDSGLLECLHTDSKNLQLLQVLRSENLCVLMHKTLQSVVTVCCMWTKLNLPSRGEPVSLLELIIRSHTVDFVRDLPSI